MFIIQRRVITDFLDRHLICISCRPDDNENGHLMKHGYNYDAGEGYFKPMGSVIIRPGCKLYGYTVRRFSLLKFLFSKKVPKVRFKVYLENLSIVLFSKK